MEPSCPHSRGHGAASTATGRPFLRLCSPNPPIGLCRETAVFLPGGSTTVPCTSQCGYVCGGEFSPPNNSPLCPQTCPIPIPVVRMSWCFPVLILLFPHLPRPSLRARMLFGGEEAGFTPLDPSDSLCWAHGKGSVRKGGTCCGCPLLGHLYPKSPSEFSQAGTSAENLSETFTLFPTRRGSSLLSFPNGLGVTGMKGGIGLIPHPPTCQNICIPSQPFPLSRHSAMLHCLELCLALGGALWGLVAIWSVHLEISMPSSQATVGCLTESMKNLAGAEGKPVPGICEQSEHTSVLELKRRLGRKNNVEMGAWFMDQAIIHHSNFLL